MSRRKRPVRDVLSDSDSNSNRPNKKARTSHPSNLQVTEHESIVIISPNPGQIKGCSKIAAFDMDSTLIVPKAPKAKFPKSRTDWKWWHKTVPTKLKQLAADSYAIVIFSNQNGIAKKRISQSDVTGKIMDLAEELQIPLIGLLAKEKDHWRKPMDSMWKYFESHYNGNVKIDYSSSFYVGDAAGRPAKWKDKDTKKDFSCSDRKFAHNIGVQFHTPESFFLGEAECANFEWRGLNPVEWIEEKENDPQRIKDIKSWFHGTLPIANQKPLELVLMRGPPGGGKSTFAKQYLEKEGYEWVNQDTLKTKAKVKKAIESALKSKKSVVVDKTHPDRASRAEWIAIGKKYKAHIRLFNMMTEREVAEHMNMVRLKITKDVKKLVGRIPYNIFYKKVREDEEPSKDEGFDEIVQIDFVPQFKDEKERKRWLQFN